MIDEKDKKILLELQKNARQSISSIARKTQLPRDVVKYRIKKLEENKIILSYHAFLDHAKLGYPMYTFVLISLSNYTLDDEKKFLSYLKQNKNVVYVGTMTGNWDIGINICARDFNQFNEIMKDIRIRFSSIIKEFTIGTIIKEIKPDSTADLIEPIN